MATKFPFLVARTSILVAKNYIQELMEYNKLNVFYLALREKRMLFNRLPFEGFRPRLDNQPLFGKMSPHSRVNLLKQVFKVQEMEYTFR